MEEQKPIVPEKEHPQQKIMVIDFCATDPGSNEKEVKTGDYISKGQNDGYFDFLIYLYKKSPKHRAITDSKRDYLTGGGLKKKSPVYGERTLVDGVEPGTSEKVPALNVNGVGETMQDVMDKCGLDYIIYNGYIIMVVWAKDGERFEMFHQSFNKFRISKDGKKFYYKEDWKNRREEAKEYPEFNLNNREGAQVFYYCEYTIGGDKYPDPEYAAATDYIQADIEVAGHTLSNAQGGFTASKMISFFNGEPEEEGKRIIERRLGEKFTGKRGKKFMLTFNLDAAKKPQIDDLGASDMTKEDFTAVDTQIQQNIFAGHRITSPMLFGIKTEGQLGGNTELKTAYEIFINTYAKPKQAKLEKVINFFGSLMDVGEDYYFAQLDPIGLAIDAKDVVNSLPKRFVYEKLNIPQEYWDDETIGGTTGTTQPAGMEQATIGVNDNVKNLTAKQHQQLLRIIRQYSKGQITRATATTLLKTGLGLSQDDITSILGPDNDTPTAITARALDFIDNDVAMVFEEYGEPRRDFNIIKTKKVKLSDCDEESEEYFALHFADTLTNTEAQIVDQIKKDPLITPDVLGELVQQPVSWVNKKLADLEKRGVIQTTVKNAGSDSETISRDVTADKVNKPKTIISVKYSYEKRPDATGATIIPGSRPFCRKLVALDRLYTRKDIENISQRLGYSVFDRAGGYWNNNGVIEYHCRHYWASNIVTTKTSE